MNTYTIIKDGKVKKTAKTKDYTLNISGIKTLTRLIGAPAEEFFRGATLKTNNTAGETIEKWIKGDITLIVTRRAS